MQPLEQEQRRLDSRYRSMITLWISFVSSIGIYFLVSRFISLPAKDDSQSRMLTFLFIALGIGMVLFSLVIRQKFLSQAIEKQQPALVQTGFVVAAAFCEAAALLGFLDGLLTGNRFYYALFIIALVGLLAHFPRRNHLLEASYRHVP